MAHGTEEIQPSADATAQGAGEVSGCAIRRGRASETADARAKRAARTVAEPIFDAGWALEYSVHKLTAATMEDARVCFERELEEEMTRLGIERKERKSYLVNNLLGVATWQPAPRWDKMLKGDWSSYELDLSLYPNQEVNQVRKQLYNKIVAWAGAMREALKKRGFWSNTACPITGSCMFGERSAHVYNELTGLTMMLNYDSIPIGCCGIVLHPTWGRAAYPVTMFTLAPFEVLKEAAAEVGPACMRCTPCLTRLRATKLDQDGTRMPAPTSIHACTYLECAHLSVCVCVCVCVCVQVGANVKLPDIESQVQKDLVEGDACM
jgi:hypothetical protein